jgi:hypothetical protein
MNAQLTLNRLRLTVLVLCAAGAVMAQSQFKLDRQDLEAVEELSESLANDLLDLSVAARQEDMSRVAEFFESQLRATPFPTQYTSLNQQTKWVHAHGWTPPGEPRRLSREEFLKDWQAFMAHFSDIDDVRFKVKGATFDSPTSGRARVFFYVVCRGCQNHREWVRGYVSIKASRPAAKAEDQPARWTINEFIVENMESLISTKDLFSEIGQPAGVAVTVPPYGSPGNEGFVWHGAAAADVDLDGDVDVVVTGLSENYLYLNEANGRFREAANAAGIKYLPEKGAAPVFLDYDNDGDQDLFISAVGHQMLFENRLKPDDRLTFGDVSLESGVAVPAVGFSAVVGDVNTDGLPDIYVASYNRYGQVMPNAWHRATNGTPNLLFVNQGKGRFKQMAREWGVDDSRWSYAAQFVDVDADGDQDLYVANDFGEKGLYLNQGGRFVDAAEARGVLDPGNGMGVMFGDYDNDGDLDLHVTNMSSTAGNRILQRLFPGNDADGDLLKKLAAGNSLFENLGDGTFKNVTQAVGGFSAGWAWGGGFIDLDNDGWEDIYSPNGFISGKSMKDT